MGRSLRQNKTQVAGIGAQRICLLSLVLIILPPSNIEALTLLNPPADELSLSAGSSIETELPAGATHSYKFELPQKSLLRIDFYSPSIDLLVSITSPVGTNSLQWNIIKRGIAPIASVLDTKGTYQLSVRSLEKNAQSGVYRLAVNSSQPAGAQAQKQVAACRHLSNAAQCRREWTEGSLRSAIREYEEALRLWKEVGDLKQEAITLKNTGDVWEMFAKWDTALLSYEKARAVYSRVDNLLGETELVNAISVLCINRGEYQRALDIYAPAHLATEDPWQKAKILRNYGAAFWGMTELSKATDYLNQALELQKKLQDLTAQADTLLYLGYVNHAMKNITAAEQYYVKSHDLFREAGNPRGRAMALTVLGDLSALSGESQRAMNYYDQSLKIFETIGELCGRYLVIRGMAALYLDLGETDKALQNYQTALNVVRQVGDMAQEADILGYTGAIYRDLGDYEKALQYTERAVEINRSLPSPQAEAYTLANLGKTQEALGNPKAALQSYARGLELSQIAKDLFLEGHFLNSLGNFYHRSGQLQRALDYYRQALSLQEQSRDSVRMPATLYNLARAERDAGNLELARQYVGKGLGITELLRGKVASSDLRSSYLASVHQQYEFMIDLLMRLHEQRPSEGFEAEALKISEQARARSLLESLVEAQADIRKGVIPDLLKRERSLQKELNTKAELQTQLLQGRHRKEKEETLAKEIAAITAEYQNVQALIRSHSPHYAALTQPQPKNLSEIQQLVDEGTLLLEYELAEERSYLWVVSPTCIQSHELPTRTEIEGRAHRVRELMLERQERVEKTVAQYGQRIKRADAEYWKEAEALSRILLGPVSDQLASKRLLVVADGILQYLPFGALPKPHLLGNDAATSPTPLTRISHQLENRG